ncbi:ATPase, T2SS/T4P/T4SS family, partial [Singulisphaera rosea]
MTLRQWSRLRYDESNIDRLGTSHPEEEDSRLMATLGERFRLELAKKNPKHAAYATEVVDLILGEARTLGASDIHLRPTPEGLEVHWRIDGVLQPGALLPTSIAPNVVARLKVLAELLTYRTDVPQEGRLRRESGEVEMRLSTFPTLYGEKAV